MHRLSVQIPKMVNRADSIAQANPSNQPREKEERKNPFSRWKTSYAKVGFIARSKTKKESQMSQNGSQKRNSIRGSNSSFKGLKVPSPDKKPGPSKFKKQAEGVVGSSQLRSMLDGKASMLRGSIREVDEEELDCDEDGLKRDSSFFEDSEKGKDKSLGSHTSSMALSSSHKVSVTDQQSQDQDEGSEHISDGQDYGIEHLDDDEIEEGMGDGVEIEESPSDSFTLDRETL